MIVSLAPELIQQISIHTESATLAALRLTCRRLADTLASQIYHTLTIDFRKYKIQSDLTRIRSMASGTHPTSRATRQLIVKSLSTGYDETEHPFWIYAFDEEPSAQKPLAVAFADAELKRLLASAFSSLKGVRTIRWDPILEDSKWAQTLFLTAILTLPNLRAFHANLAACHVPILLSSFPPMRELSVKGLRFGEDDIFGTNLIPQISELVGRSPNLTLLAIEGPFSDYQGWPHKPTLRHLLNSLSEDSQPLPLRSLSLKDFHAQLDLSLVRHFRNLTTLSLFRVQESGSGSEIHDSNVDDFWKIIRTEKIELQEITTDRPTEEFLAYLGSYRGLRSLTLEASGFMGGIFSDHAALIFYSTALKPHFDSLEHLSISPQFEGGWCFSAQAMPVIIQCRKLKTLQMSITSSFLYKDNDSAKALSEDNIVRLLIDAVAAYLPSLEKLRIDAADLEQYRYFFAGPLSLAHFGRTWQHMYQCVEHYVAPPGCKRLPKMEIGSRRCFTPKVVELAKHAATRLLGPARLLLGKDRLEGTYCWIYEYDNPPDFIGTPFGWR